MLEKFQGGMLGLAVGDSMCRTDGKWSEETQIALIVSRCLSLNSPSEDYEKYFAMELAEWSKTQKEDSRNADLATFFAAESGSPLENDSTCQVAFSVPVGFYFYRNIPKTIDFARSTAAAMTKDSSSQCCAVASALMGLYAILDVPVGLWGNELTSFVKGIDNYLLEGIQMTTLLCAKHKKIDDFNTYLGGFSPAIVTVCGSLFCCMSYPNTIEKALETAVEMSGDNDAIAATVGACMGAKFGLKGISEEKMTRLESKQLILDAAGELFNGSKTTDPVE